MARHDWGRPDPIWKHSGREKWCACWVCYGIDCGNDPKELAKLHGVTKATLLRCYEDHGHTLPTLRGAK